MGLHACMASMGKQDNKPACPMNLRLLVFFIFQKIAQFEDPSRNGLTREALSPLAVLCR
jgi:hypothetical protein